MLGRTAPLVIAIAACVALVSLFIDHPLSAWWFGGASLMFIPALIALGGRGRSAAGALLLLFFALYLIICFSAILLLSPEPDPETGWLGLPPATIVMLGGLWLLPLPAVALWYAIDFERSNSEAGER